MERAGDVLVGWGLSRHDSQDMLSKGPRHTLIYGIPELNGIATVGVFPATTESNVSVFDMPKLTVQWPSFCFSYASLDKVYSVQVFYQRDWEHCQGLLIVYEGGAQRALGQCRVGWDPYLTYIRPSVLCTAPRDPRPNLQGHQFEVRCVLGHELHKHQGYWRCYPMRGILQCWFKKNEIMFN